MVYVWLNNQIVRDQLKFDIKVCLIKNGYPPQYSPEVFRKVMEQVENFEENSDYAFHSSETTASDTITEKSAVVYDIIPTPVLKVAERTSEYGKKEEP